MATKPSTYLGWTPSGLGSNVVEPTSAVKTAGWVGGQPPPYQNENYILWLFDQWIQWFDFVNPSSSQTKVSGNFTVDGVTRTYLCDVTVASFNGTLPLASTCPGYRVTFKNHIYGSSNTVTPVRTGSDTIEGQTTAPAVAAGEYITFESDGVSDWFQVG